MLSTASARYVAPSKTGMTTLTWGIEAGRDIKLRPYPARYGALPYPRAADEATEGAVGCCAAAIVAILLKVALV
jgi:hypothetical protein